MESGVAVVLVTAPSQEVAEQIVTTVVEERLAACGNIVSGVTSIYRWNEATQRDSEVLIIFKTLRTTMPRLTARVTALHPYDVPEVIGLPLLGGASDYMAWVTENSTG